VKGIKLKRSEMRLNSDNKGIVLLVVVLIITVISVYLASYVIWAVYDQRNLMRQQKADKAEQLAFAGLERAKADLFLDDNWLDGDINGAPVSTPDSNDPDKICALYSETSFGEGSYKVDIDYLQNPASCTAGCSFYARRIRVRSTGYIPNATAPQVSKPLEEIVSLYTVKNLTQSKFYSLLQPAIDGSSSGDTLAVTGAVLNENITISSNVNIEGSYDTDFQYRDYVNYHSRISGNVTVTSPANVTMGGITIE